MDDEAEEKARGGGAGGIGGGRGEEAETKGITRRADTVTEARWKNEMSV